jgi:ABC-2 type transport system permease protein
MHKILVVAIREYNAAVRTKTFLIGLLLMPIMMGGSLAIQVLIQDKDRHYAVIDRTGGKAYEALKLAIEAYNKVPDPETGKETQTKIFVEKVEPMKDVAEQRLELSDRVRRGELSGFLDIGAEALKASPPRKKGENAPERPESQRVRLQTNQGGGDVFGQVATAALSGVAQDQRLKALKETLLPTDSDKITEETIGKITAQVEVTPKGLSSRDPATGKIVDYKGKERLAEFLVPFALLMLMFMVIFMGATPLMQGVVEEKIQRIAEVLLGSVRPFELMMGKLLGLVGVSLTMSAVYLGGGYWLVHHFGFARFISVELLLWFLVFQALAALMYGSLFVAVGAACSDIRETQNLLLPVMLLAMAPMFVVSKVLTEPNGPVSMWMSFFPFATPMLMIVRLAGPDLPLWQPLLGIVVVLATTMLCVWIAGRIFRVGILMQGKGANLAQIVRWVVRG